MSEIIFAKDVTLHDLEEKFALCCSEEEHFFPEWQTGSPDLSAEEKHFLDMARAAYWNLSKYAAMPENAVKLTVLSPLLHLAGLLLPPFHIRTEASVSITGPNEDIAIEGRIDILVLEQDFWVLVIESKRAEFSLKVGLAQLLSYMLSNPAPDKPCFGLITNGGSFVFLKLMPGEPPVYGMSRAFDLLNPGNDLYAVLAVLKRIRSSHLLQHNKEG